MRDILRHGLRTRSDTQVPEAAVPAAASIVILPSAVQVAAIPASATEAAVVLDHPVIRIVKLTTVVRAEDRPAAIREQATGAPAEAITAVLFKAMVVLDRAMKAANRFTTVRRPLHLVPTYL